MPEDPKNQNNGARFEEDVDSLFDEEDDETEEEDETPPEDDG